MRFCSRRLVHARLVSHKAYIGRWLVVCLSKVEEQEGEAKMGRRVDLNLMIDILIVSICCKPQLTCVVQSCVDKCVLLTVHAREEGRSNTHKIAAQISIIPR